MSGRRAKQRRASERAGVAAKKATGSVDDVAAAAERLTAAGVEYEAKSSRAGELAGKFSELLGGISDMAVKTRKAAREMNAAGESLAAAQSAIVAQLRAAADREQEKRRGGSNG